VAGLEHGLYRPRRLRGRHAVEDRALLLAARIAHDHLQHEAVDLRLGKRVGAFLLDRVLGRHDQERIGERIRLLSDRDLVLLHRFEESALHLRGRSIDLVREDQVREDRAVLGDETAVLLVVDQRADDVRGEHVGRELEAMEASPSRPRKGLQGERLGEAGDALQQDVPAGDQSDEEALDEMSLADDRMADLGTEG
jgi:hypothetical protein